ncbi:MAG TPA: SDR family oxidoreductase [Gaiellaceae bacterium]|nr:SDR family oxidoreductase [Gaiellaceae bacterium]
MALKFDFSGQCVVITGGASGIGRATAIAFARAGANVAVLDVNEAGVDETLDACTALGASCLGRSGDVGDPGAVAVFASDVETALGGIDVWINNAGRVLMAAFTDITNDEWASLVRVNVYGYVYGCRAAIERMLVRGAGTIINVTSVTARQPITGLSAYTTTKAAVAGLTRSLALEYAGTGIRINAVSPGVIQTELNRELLTPAAREANSARIALHRLGEPVDIASVILFLASPEASYIVGEEVLVDGGLTLNGDVT